VRQRKNQPQRVILVTEVHHSEGERCQTGDDADDADEERHLTSAVFFSHFFTEGHSVDEFMVVFGGFRKKIPPRYKAQSGFLARCKMGWMQVFHAFFIGQRGAS
jgi:hypothetical protein